MSSTPLKSFELFFDDAMIKETVTWTNQKTENVKTSYTSKTRFLYNTSMTEIRALISILLFLGATKSSKESTASIWAKDGTGKPICIATMSHKRFLFLVYCLRFDDSTTRAQRRADDKLAPIRNIYDKFVAACEANYTPGTGCAVDESLHGFRGMCSFMQYIPNKQSKYVIKVYVLADGKHSTRFLPKFTMELALMHLDCQSQPKLFWIWFRQFREQTETLPLTIITRQFLWPWS